MASYDDSEGTCLSDQAESIGKLVGIGVSVADIKVKNELLYAIVPEGYELKTKDLAERNEKLADNKKIKETGRPVRNVGDVMVADVDSFVTMVKREMLPDDTMITAHMKNQNFNAVINWGKNGQEGGHCDRKIILVLQKTTEFLRWEGKNRARMSQLQLADFIEENLESISSPPAAEMIEMISDLKVKRNASFHSVIDTKTGMQSLSYTEEIKGETVKGNLEFQSKFKVALTPFQGSKLYEIDCNLRFSIDDNRPNIFFSMVNLSKVMEVAFTEESDKIRKEMTVLGLPVINIR